MVMAFSNSPVVSCMSTWKAHICPNSLTMVLLITKINTDFDTVNTYSKFKSHNYPYCMIIHMVTIRITVD